VVSVAPGSPAARAGVRVGDVFVAVNGDVPRDVLEYRWLVDDPEVHLTIRRGGMELDLEVQKSAGEPLGAEVHSAVFDRVVTCDNHCEFCFIYQLPKGLRRSLYLKDDDYRLSFLYGNFTTLTRFTEADFERVLTEGLSPLNVSIHATDPDVRAEMLRNRRGRTSLRWLRALLDHGVEVHGQIVVCPGVNDGEVLEDTFAGILDEYSALASVCVVPLGVSRFNHEPRMRPHTAAEARAVVAAVHDWQEVFTRVLGRRMVFAADEYYLLAGEPFPPFESYEGFPMHEDGVGMARAFEAEFFGAVASGPSDSAIDERPHVASGFFQWIDGAPASGYRSPRVESTLRTPGVSRERAMTDANPAGDGAIAILTGEYGAEVIAPLVASLGRADVRVVPVPNMFFGGNTAVTGLMVGEDVARVLAREPVGDRYLLPDVCLTRGQFLDGRTPDDLPRPVEIVRTDGGALRAALEQTPDFAASGGPLSVWMTGGGTT
jgi:putative radical SAM enzyme (TIGR03279 family)